MIRYTLTCDKDHSFDSWFHSISAFDSLAHAGHLACAVCGSAQVSRAMMAPAVSAKTGTTLSKPANKAETALSNLRTHVEANSDYVGPRFASEARKMHDGDAPNRPIWGEASGAEAKKLIEDGVPVLPLPFMPKRNVN